MTLDDRGEILRIAGVPIPELAVEFGTPLYVMSQRTMIDKARSLDAALGGKTPHTICYAVKANPTLGVIQTFAQMGLGADVTSGGEIQRALKAGVVTERMMYSGVGKTMEEIGMALDVGVRAFHVESEFELRHIAAAASARRQNAPIALRVNPEVDAHTHPGITTGLGENKFGIAWDQIAGLVDAIKDEPALKLIGLSCHIGSQVVELDPFRLAAERVAVLARSLVEQGYSLEYVDFGGGLGVRYRDEEPPDFASWGQTLRAALGDLPLELIVEPGRSLVAEAGILVTRVLGIKETAHKTFVIVDAAMNDLIRPMLYGAHHPILPVSRRDAQPAAIVDIVGPVCETTDTLASARSMPLPHEGDLLAILHTGAYGSSMASNYNSRRRAAEVLIPIEGLPVVMRARESWDDLTRGESLIP